MLQITYIGHAGWVFQADGRAIVVDPLLHADFGRGPDGARMPLIWPPRNFCFEAFPKLDAVVISHEHEDHFNLPSLNLVDRSVPVLLSARASAAARSALAYLGFSTCPLDPGRTHRFGSLELTALSPDHIETYNCDEWDGLALFICDDRDEACFFTTVDVMPARDMIQRACALASQASSLLVFHGERLRWIDTGSIPRIPEFSEQEPVSGAAAVRHTELLGGAAITATPGDTIVVSAKQILQFEPVASFIYTAPREQWPERPLWRTHPDADYGPACGRLELSDDECDELLAGLQQLADWLYGTILYRRLYSLTMNDIRPKPHLLLVLLADASRSCYLMEYDPASCSFQSVSSSQPTREYVCGIECWATDLLALMRGTFEPRILSLGRSRTWSLDNGMPDLFQHVVWPFFHPQRRPAECLRGYREQIARLPKHQALLFGRASAPTLSYKGDC